LPDSASDRAILVDFVAWSPVLRIIPDDLHIDVKLAMFGMLVGTERSSPAWPYRTSIDWPTRRNRSAFSGCCWSPAFGIEIAGYDIGVDVR
jgi:hypothetical protein